MKSTFHALNAELSLLAPEYERILPYDLEGFPTLAGLLERLTDPARRREMGHRGLICTVLAVHRDEPHRVWTAILLRTFRPKLKKVFKKLVGCDRETRVTLLLTAFQEAISTVDPYRDPLRIAMYIRQATRRAVFAALARENDWEEVGFGVEADEEPDESGPALALAVEWVHDTPEPRRELLGTLGEHGALRALVRQRHPALPQRDQLRVYAQLRRDRTQIADELRDRFRPPRRKPARLKEVSS